MSASEDSIDFESAIIDDNIKTELQIGTTTDGEPIFWDLIQIEIRRSKITEPDFAKGIARPQEEYREDVRDRVLEVEDAEDAAFGPGALIGGDFSISVDTGLSVEKSPEGDDSNIFRRIRKGQSGGESSLLFTGNVASLSPTGKESYKFTAYDPTQQALEVSRSDGSIDARNSGSIINKRLDFTGETPQLVDLNAEEEGSEDEETNEPPEFRINAFKFIELLADELPIPDEDITIRPFPTDLRQGDIQTISFENAQIPFKIALDQVKEQFDIEWWVNREGEFYFGNPSELDGGIRVFDLKLITETSAGVTTPPYQSVQVIGSSQQSDAESPETANVSTAIQDDNERIVKGVNIGLPKANAPKPVVSTTKGEDQKGELLDPTFTYINTALTTDIQVENAARSIATDLIEQQAEGTATVTGLPEIDPFDGIRMPNTDNQPMGGRAYGVYGIRHKINSGDGFITEIEVSGPIFDDPNVVDIGREETSVESQEKPGPDRTATAASSSTADFDFDFGFGEPAELQGRAATGVGRGENEFPALFSSFAAFLGRVNDRGTERAAGRRLQGAIGQDIDELETNLEETDSGVSNELRRFSASQQEVDSNVSEALDDSFDFLERVSPEEPEEGVAEGRRGGAEDEDEE
jgi:hypothetical protein